jgi:ParB family chromosome partitioning protein|tara:strand:+ start:65 stop:949 length:885 start_codon:yes stop_codon:yes gene_type:complete
MKWNKEINNIDVKLSDIHPNPKNPRKDYDKREMEELMESLKSLGQLNNCILDYKGNLLVGHRRHFAAKELRWKTLNCDIKSPDTSEFKKSAIMISSNVTQIQFNAWANREAVARIYWDEFLEEYTPRSNNDKGYTTFAKEMGLSASYVKKIIEVSRGENKKYYDRLKKENVDTSTVDEVLTAPKELRTYLTDLAIRRTKKNKGLESDKRRREYIRAAKRKALLESSDYIDKRKFRIWLERIDSLGFELGNHIIEKGNEDDLQKLEISIRKNILGFYNKLTKALNKKQNNKGDKK